MGIVNSKDYIRKIDEATSNSSLSNLRYVITEKPKWKVFKKKEIVPLPPNRGVNRCPCGSEAPCKQKITPKGVTLHYPQPKKETKVLQNPNATRTVEESPAVDCKRKKRFGAFGHNKRYTPPKIDKSYFNSPRTVQKVKLIRQKKFPTWRLDHITCKTPFASSTPAPATPATATPAPATEPASQPARPVQKVKLIRQKKWRTWTLDEIPIKLPPMPSTPKPTAPPPPPPPAPVVTPPPPAEEPAK